MSGFHAGNKQQQQDVGRPHLVKTPLEVPQDRRQLIKLCFCDLLNHLLDGGGLQAAHRWHVMALKLRCDLQSTASMRGMCMSFSWPPTITTAFFSLTFMTTLPYSQGAHAVWSQLLS